MADKMVNNQTNFPLNINGAGKYTLSTKDKYINKDIEINVQKGSLEVAINSIDGNDNAISFTAPEVNPILTITPSDTVTSTFIETRPTEGQYFVIGAGARNSDNKGSISVNGTANISLTPGWIANAGDSSETEISFTKNNLTASIGNNDTQYLPIFDVAEKITAQIAENYIEPETTPDGDTTEYSDKIKFSVNIPAGYYKGGTFEKTFEDIIPGIDSNLSSAEILSGKSAYDVDGKRIVGTMSKNNLVAANVTGKAGATSIAPSNCSLSSTDDSGIEIVAQGYVTPSATVSTGYYEAKSVDGAVITSNANTQYLNSITIGSGKTLSSVINNGTISSLSGNGTISSLQGNLNIADLTNTSKLTVKGVTIVENGTTIMAEVSGAANAQTQKYEVSTTAGHINAGIISTIDFYDGSFDFVQAQ